MSEFIVKGPEVFVDLKNAFLELNQRVSPQIASILQEIESLKNKLNNDLIETTNELRAKSSELEQVKKQNDQKTSDPGQEPSKNLNDLSDLHREAEDLKNKHQELVNAQSTIDHLIFQVKQCESKISQKIAESKKGLDALVQFEEIAKNYLSISTNFIGSSNYEHGKSNSTSTKPKTELVGDTIHISKENNTINQMDIDSAMNNMKSVNQGSQKANKISFSEVSQSSFSILEKNGFTIQKIEPNKYSAYKEI
jgi:hypothetical protein